MKKNAPGNPINFGMPLAAFLRQHWQKEPLLIRAAFSDFQCPLSANDLAGIACQRHALARLVLGSGSRFKLESGPFEASRFATLGKKNWTLLVQEVDQWDASVRALLRHFSFLPRWRIEDVMVSYAVTGGSVGAHIDQYDVFLLQGRGQRRWQIDDRVASRAEKNPLLVANAPLKLLKHFKANREWVLAPGDMLYLPPGVAHHGIALDDDCMTLSIGLRAPSSAEMLQHLLAQEHFSDAVRYQDADLSDAASDDSTLDTASIARVRQAFSQVLALPDAQLGDWFAGYMSGYRAPQLANLKNASAQDLAALAARLLQGAVLSLSPGMRVLSFGKQIYLGGISMACSVTLSRHLCAFEVAIDARAFAKLNGTDQLLLARLLRSKALKISRVANLSGFQTSPKAPLEARKRVPKSSA
jgi:50S ribosomal protein L16 3-hydroxylase